ncbi:unnamed protein product [Musa hybrid cultivar]
MLVMTVGVQNLFCDHIDLLVGIAFGHSSWLLWQLMQVESTTAPHRVNKSWPVSGFIYYLLRFPLFEFCSLPSIKMVCS